MSRNSSALLLALFLGAISLAIFFHKLVTLDLPLLPNQAVSSWYVETRLSTSPEFSSFTNNNQEESPAKINFYLPQESQVYQIDKENFINDGFDRNIKETKDSTNRQAIFQKNSNKTKSEETIFYRATIRYQENIKPVREEVPISGQKLVDTDVKQLIKETEKSQKDKDSENNLPTSDIESIIEEARTKSNDKLSLIKQIYQLCLDPEDIRIKAIKRGIGKEVSTPEIATLLLNKANISARLGNGIYLREKEIYSTDFVQWIEVQSENDWLVFDANDRTLKAENPYLVWWYGSDSVLQTPEGDNLNIKVVVQPNTNKGITQSILAGKDNLDPFVEYSLLGLPLSTQRIFQVLVLIPIGALIISVLHQMVGLTTFGTFTPVLISLTFRQTGLLIGILLFIFVVILGLLIRNYLNKLQLLVVPRLAAILTLTVLILGVLAVAIEKTDLNLGLSISLFPIVILATTIERASTMWEEEGVRDTVVAGVGTIIASVIGYFCMVNDYVSHWAFIFPELLLIILGINILVGRYNGYRLIEYFRFLSLQKQLKESAES